jgi:hypothetical protein
MPLYSIYILLFKHQVNGTLGKSRYEEEGSGAHLYRLSAGKHIQYSIMGEIDASA